MRSPDCTPPKAVIYVNARNGAAFDGILLFEMSKSNIMWLIAYVQGVYKR